jgi:glycerol-3-phosphate acyltransferase PlsX
MGGDFAPAAHVHGAIQALREFPDLELFLVGDEPRVKAELAQHGRGSWLDRVTIRHASQVIDMTDGAVDAVRKKKDSSINRSVELLKDDTVQAVVSAGHTGALVAATTIKLRTLPGIGRPGIATVMPTQNNFFLLIDAGANVDAHPDHLVGYAIMGSIYAREVLGCAKPRVGLLSIGSEAGKGNDFTREVFKLLSQANIHFVGNIEGHVLFTKPVDVIVCDGFIGNVVLKTSENLATAIFAWLKHELNKNPLRQAGALMARDAFAAIRKKTNTEEYGGMPLLGVNGICIKAHGNSSAKAIKNAIRVARESVNQQVNPRIIAEMSRHHEASQKTVIAAAS